MIRMITTFTSYDTPLKILSDFENLTESNSMQKLSLCTQKNMFALLNQCRQRFIEVNTC